MLRGQWPEAEQEARQACEELERFGLLDARRLRPVRRSARSGCGWAISTRPPRRSSGRTSTATTPSPGMALLQLARGEVDEATRVDRPRARRDGRHGRSRRPGDPGAAAAGPGRHRPRGRRPRDRGTAVDGARVDRRRLRAARLRGRRPDGARRAAPRRGLGRRRRRRSWAGRGGCGRRRTCRTRAPGRACTTPRRWRPKATRRPPAGTCARPAAAFERLGAKLDLRAGGCAAGRRERAVDRSSGTTRDQDLHVHRHRDLDGPGRADRRRRLGRAAALARPGAAVGLRRATAARRSITPATASSSPSSAPSMASSAPSTSSDAWPDTAASTASRHACGSACTRPRRRARAATTTGRGVHVAARVGAAASERGDPRLERDLAAIGTPSGSACRTRVVTLKGVDEPVEVRSVDWR